MTIAEMIKELFGIAANYDNAAEEEIAKMDKETTVASYYRGKADGLRCAKEGDLTKEEMIKELLRGAVNDDNAAEEEITKMDKVTVLANYYKGKADGLLWAADKLLTLR